MSSRTSFLAKKLFSGAGLLQTITVVLLTPAIFVLAAYFPRTVENAFAAVRCETQYGGGETCVRTGELQINKKVYDPDEKDSNLVYKDNLGITAHRFAPGETVTFRLYIKNVGDETFDKVYVNDTLPSFLELSSDSPNVLYFEISDLTPGEEEVREIKAKIVSSDRISSGTVCDVNTGEAWHDSERDKDTAQICVSKKVQGITTVPETGANLYVYALGLLVLGLLGAAGAIFLSRKK